MNEALNKPSDKNEAKKKPQEELPGYLKYPSNEDILNSKNQGSRVDTNIENLTKESLSRQSPVMKDVSVNPDKMEDEESIKIVPGTEADVTKDDLLALEAIDHEMEGGNDEINSDGSASAFSATEETATDLDEKDLTGDLERTGDDLDIPGVDLDDANEDIGEEDEENNYYSLGGDDKENLEEDATAEGY